MVNKIESGSFLAPKLAKIKGLKKTGLEKQHVKYGKC